MKNAPRTQYERLPEPPPPPVFVNIVVTQFKIKPLNPEWLNQEIRPMNECRLVGVVDGKYVRYRKQRQWN